MLSRTCLLSAFALAIAASAASSWAQIIYEPIQYQYGEQNKFYYGGTDPHVFERAAVPSDPGAVWGRVNGFDFASADVRVHREVCDQPARVFSDALPTQSATLYGFTPADAENVANASMPRYFRKADVLNAAAEAPGILIVPARALFLPAPRQAVSVPAPTTRPTLILPRAMLQTPVPPSNSAKSSDKLIVVSH
jgi:hypothetical protein